MPATILNAPDGYGFKAFGFGEASPELIASFLELRLWDPLKERSRIRRLLVEALDDPEIRAGLAFVTATHAPTGAPAGLFPLERIKGFDLPVRLLKNPFQLESKPARELDKSFRLRSWFMAYTVAGHRRRGVAAWAAQVAEGIDLAAFPPAPGEIPLVLAVEDAQRTFDRGARRSYSCRHLPPSVNVARELHFLAQRFMQEAAAGPVFGREDLAGYRISEIAPQRAPKAAKASKA